MPKVIIEKSADPDIIPGVDDKGKLLGSFLEAGRILSSLEKGMSQEDLVRNYGDEAVQQIMTLIELSRPMRESPYVL